MSLDYKSKYKELRAKMLESTDVAYRLGYADGLKQGSQDAQMQQMQQMQQAMMQPQIDPATGQPIQGGQPGMEGQMGGQPGQPGMDPVAQGGAGGVDPMTGQPMVDQGMMQQPGEEGDMGQGEQSELDQYIQELEGLVAKGEKPTVMDLRKKVTELANLRKSQKMKVKNNQKEVASSQKKLVDNILKKWEKESTATSENLEDLLKEQGLKLS